MSPLLPGKQSALSGPRHIRGLERWVDPRFPTGASATPHRCPLLRTPRARETDVPILTLHTLTTRHDAINYRGLKVPTVVDARMTMFIRRDMIGDFCFELTSDDMEEIEDCLLVALDLSVGEVD